MRTYLIFNQNGGRNKMRARRNNGDVSRNVPISYGQSTAEYVILIAIVSAVLLAMQSYMRMSIQGVIKVAADQVGRQEDSWEGADVDDAAKTDTKETDTASSTTRARTMQGGNYRTDVNETSNSDLWYGHSESEQKKY